MPTILATKNTEIEDKPKLSDLKTTKSKPNSELDPIKNEKEYFKSKKDKKLLSKSFQKLLFFYDILELQCI